MDTYGWINYLLTIMSIVIPVFATLYGVQGRIKNENKEKHKPYIILDSIKSLTKLDEYRYHLAMVGRNYREKYPNYNINKIDNTDIIDKMIKKIVNLRVFEDDNEKMNLSILDIGGSILSISQFTLYANSKKGNRPSFIEAMNPEEASKLYDIFNQKLSEILHVETGIFGADMKVEIYNDGPVTIMLDSEELFNK